MGGLFNQSITIQIKKKKEKISCNDCGVQKYKQLVCFGAFIWLKISDKKTLA